MNSKSPDIILASSSPYRVQLLTKLGLKFTVVSPNVAEQALPDETPPMITQRLSEAKARAVATTHSGLIIGSDQLAALEGVILSKPHTHEKAVEQLQFCAGKKVNFFTSLTLLNTHSQQIETDVITFSVFFRQLTTAQINHYLYQEQPYDCAGSFKAEGLGIALFEKMAGDDPSSLIGLPLITLTQMLAAQGVDVLCRQS